MPNAYALPAAPLATAPAVSPPSAPPPIPPAYAAPSTAPAASSSEADPPRQLAPVAVGGDPEDQTDHVEIPAILHNLRRQRAVISILVMPRWRLAVVDILFPEAGAEAIRANLITRISRHLQPFHFRNNAIPEFQPSVGEVLRIPRRAYARLHFSWPSQDNADDFKGLSPLTFHLPNSRSMLLKVYVDRYPRFTSAKAGGAATLTLRNVPPGYTPEDLHTFLMHQNVAGEPSWLTDLQIFHQVKDPYEDAMRTALLTPPARLLSSYPPFLEHPISSSGLFLRSCVANAALPAAPPHRYPPCPSCPVLGLSSLFGQPLGFMHPPRICKVLLPPSLALPSLPLLPRFQPIIPPWAAPPCSSTEYFSHLPSPFPHRPPLRFPLPILYMGRPSARLPRRACSLPQRPGLLYIGLDADVEPWTCALCNLTCGAALDSAMAHIASELHAAKKISAAHLPAAKEKYTGWKAVAFVALP
ncbi:unnamed protein product [Closterium sp. Naga37s-1]|nr:unnamed protein product [Closterium sp. Naga37s-1]